MQGPSVMARHRHPSGIVSGGGFGSVTPESVAEHLARIGYRCQREAGGEGPAVVLQPGNARSGRVVRRIYLWQHDAQSLAYAIDFVPIRALQVLGAACCAAGTAIALLRPTFWCLWLLATAIVLLAVPEAILAVARYSTRETLEWAVRCPSMPVARCEHSAVSFPQFVRNS